LTLRDPSKGKIATKTLTAMRKNQYGRIVNVSSGAGSLYYMEGGTPQHTAYPRLL
jgi:hypothetical protein